jgi:Protein of unknown function (DUF1838)
VIDLSAPRDNMRAFVRARASLDGSDTVTWFAGNVHAWMPGGKFAHLLAFEGYNVSRIVEAEGGYDLLTREAVFYQDPRTGEILERWTNPLTQAEVDVVHVWNDPVNQQFRLEGPRGPWNVPVTSIGDDVFFNVDVFLAYPSPLPRAQYPLNSQDDLYQAAELFQFFCKQADLADASSASVPSQVSWTRIAPWLPFMEMGERPGQLVYHGRGAKVAGGYPDVPSHIRDYVEKHHPQFASAPREFTQPNETSWTYFRTLNETRTAGAGR